MTKYIRGWRQIKAPVYILKCLFGLRFKCIKRELHIMTGFAREYKMELAPSFLDKIPIEDRDEVLEAMNEILENPWLGEELK